MGRGYKIAWSDGKETLHDPEDDTFENALHLEYYEYIGVIYNIYAFFTSQTTNLKTKCLHQM